MVFFFLCANRREIIDYLKDLSNGSTANYKIKLMVVGQENVGKTTLITSLSKGKKNTIKKKEPLPNLSTDGIDIEDWTLKNVPFKEKDKIVKRHGNDLLLEWLTDWTVCLFFSEFLDLGLCRTRSVSFISSVFPLRSFSLYSLLRSAKEYRNVPSGAFFSSCNKTRFIFFLNELILLLFRNSGFKVWRRGQRMLP
jgi:GTPase SAR1 family protein